jgi:hypothetical protein
MPGQHSTANVIAAPASRLIRLAWIVPLWSVLAAALGRPRDAQA